MECCDHLVQIGEVTGLLLHMFVYDVSVRIGDNHAPVLEAVSPDGRLPVPGAERAAGVPQRLESGHLSETPLHAEVLVTTHARIHEYGEVDTLLLDEAASPTGMTAADSDQLCPGSLDLIQSLSEASSLLAAEHSTEVAQEGDDCGLAMDNVVELDDSIIQALDGDQCLSPFQIESAKTQATFHVAELLSALEPAHQIARCYQAKDLSVVNDHDATDLPLHELVDYVAH